MMNDIVHAFMFILVAGAFFLMLMLIEYFYLKRQQRDNAYDLKESSVNILMGFIYKVFNGIVIAVVITLFYDKLLPYGLQIKIENKWLSIFLVAICTDLWFYVLHTIMHKVRYAWCTHATHHSSERFNLSTALRQNFLGDLSGLNLLWWLPFVFIGFDKNLVVICIEANLFYQFFFHTEAIKKLPKWYEFIFNTPSHHRVHHGSNPKQIDTNFGGVLIIWDRLFGTFVAEEDAGKIVYGIRPKPKPTLNPLVINLREFVAMWKDVWQYKDLRILWKTPNWINEKNITGDK